MDKISSWPANRPATQDTHTDKQDIPDADADQNVNLSVRPQCSVIALQS